MKKHFWLALLITILFGLALATMKPEWVGNIWFRLFLFFGGLAAGGLWGTFFLMLGLVGGRLKGDE